MIVPQYWAEAKIKTKIAGRQYTLKRFGWSDHSLEAAQTHAEQRVTEAIERVKAGEKFGELTIKSLTTVLKGSPYASKLLLNTMM